MSTNLNAPSLTGGQANPETTVNDAVGALDAALTEVLTVNLTNDATVTAANYRACIRIDVTPAGVGKTLTLQAIKRLVLITNSGANAITVALSVTNITLGVGEHALVYTDGTSNGLIKVVLGAVVAIPYDVAFFVPGVGTNNQKLLRFNADRAFTIPASLTGSVFKADVAATGTTVFTLKKNGSSIGSLSFAASGTTPSVTFSSDVAFAAGDIFGVDGPATADATLADLAFTFKGSR